MKRSFLVLLLTQMLVVISFRTQAQLTYLAQTGGKQFTNRGYVAYDGNNRLYSFADYTMYVGDTLGNPLKEKVLDFQGVKFDVKQIVCSPDRQFLYCSTYPFGFLIVDTALNVVNFNANVQEIKTLCVAQNKTVYACDKQDNRIIYHISGSTGIVLKQFNLTAVNDFVSDIKSDSQGNIILFSNYIYKFSPDETLLSKTLFPYFVRVQMLNDSVFLTADYYTRKITEATLSGKRLYETNILPVGYVSKLNTPAFLFRTPGNNYLVHDKLGGAVGAFYQFSRKGKSLNTFGWESGYENFLEAPEMLVINPRGGLLVGNSSMNQENSQVTNGESFTGDCSGNIYALSPLLGVQYMIPNQYYYYGINFKNNLMYKNIGGALEVYDTLMNMTNKINIGWGGRFVFDKEGNFFFSKPNHNPPYTAPAAVRYNATASIGFELNTSVGFDLAAKQIPYIKGIAVNSHNELIVISPFFHQVHALSDWGVHLRLHHVYGSESDNVKYPIAVAVDQYDNIFICESWAHRIKITDRFGNFIANVGSQGSGNGQFRYPADIAIDTATHTLYVADRNNHRVQSFRINYPLPAPESKNTTNIKYVGNAASAINVFPNPATDVVHIESKTEMQNIELYNMQGSLCYKLSQPLFETTIPLTPTWSGLMILKIQTQHGVTTQKVFCNRF